MKIHLKPEEIAAAVAGLVIDDEAQAHLESCVVCRAEVADFDELVDARRRGLLTEEPDWEAQAERIMARLPAGTGTQRRRHFRWFRPALAVAATVVLAVGVGILRPDRPVAPPAGQLSVEEILAEVDELLSDESIPGFEIIDPEIDDLENYFDNGAS
jgi:anti-sigma factor RsiW